MMAAVWMKDGGITRQELLRRVQEQARLYGFSHITLELPGKDSFSEDEAAEIMAQISATYTIIQSER